MRTRHAFSGTSWEAKVGYARAIRVGAHIHVSGTTAVDVDGSVLAAGDPYRQTVHVLERIRDALDELGAGIDQVVRTRIYVTEIGHWPEVGRAHGEFFGSVRPASTLVEVSRLIDRDLLVEIEADAFVQEP